MNKKKHIWGIIITKEDSAEEAKKAADTMKNCPYLVAIGTSSNTIHSVYMVPEDKKWWLKYPETLNEKLGAEKYKVQIVENAIYPNKFTLKTPQTETPPCGANCQTCKVRTKYNCNGCPTIIP